MSASPLKANIHREGEAKPECAVQMRVIARNRAAASQPWTRIPVN
jgi:hypothetical protein